jgi:hypothetical protein
VGGVGKEQCWNMWLAQQGKGTECEMREVGLGRGGWVGTDVLTSVQQWLPAEMTCETKRVIVSF